MFEQELRRAEDNLVFLPLEDNPHLLKELIQLELVLELLQLENRDW